MGKKNRVEEVKVPANLEEAAEFLHRIAEEQRAIVALNADLNAQIDALKTKTMEKVKPHSEGLTALVQGLFVFAQANRKSLTEEGKRKTVELPTGSFGWRFTPPAVFIRDVKKVLEALKAGGFTRFIRTKEEIDKEAMLREPEAASAIKGVKIGQKEDFVVKTPAVDAEIVTEVKKLE